MQNLTDVRRCGQRRKSVTYKQQINKCQQLSHITANQSLGTKGASGRGGCVALGLAPLPKARPPELTRGQCRWGRWLAQLPALAGHTAREGWVFTCPGAPGNTARGQAGVCFAEAADTKRQASKPSCSPGENERSITYHKKQ